MVSFRQQRVIIKEKNKTLLKTHWKKKQRRLDFLNKESTNIPLKKLKI
jgi:hypothetical protein